MIQKLLPFVIVLFAAIPSYSLEVTFLPEAHVSAATVSLGDIAVLSEDNSLARALSTKIISRSPAPGQVDTLDSRNIITTLVKENRELNTVFWKGSSTISVERDSVTITAEKVLDIIDTYIAENRGRLPNADISFKPESLPLPFLLPTGAMTCDVIPSSPGIIGSNRFALIFKVEGRVCKNFSVRGETPAIAPIVVARKRLRYGDIVTPESIGLAPRDIAGLDDYIVDPKIVIGSSIKRALNSGAAIDRSAIEQPPVVRRGELVKIIISHNGLILTATGIAKNDGKKDDVIRVKNASSNKLVYCRVHSPGLVEVNI